MVCGVNGAAVGAGMSLALAADLRIGCTKKSRFLASFVKLGLGGEVPINAKNICFAKATTVHPRCLNW